MHSKQLCLLLVEENLHPLDGFRRYPPGLQHRCGCLDTVEQLGVTLHHVVSPCLIRQVRNMSQEYRWEWKVLGRGRTGRSWGPRGRSIRLLKVALCRGHRLHHLRCHVRVVILNWTYWCLTWSAQLPGLQHVLQALRVHRLHSGGCSLKVRSLSDVTIGGHGLRKRSNRWQSMTQLSLLHVGHRHRESGRGLECRYLLDVRSVIAMLRMHRWSR